jgi:hypothetical protein
MPQQVYTVELDGKQYDIEGDRPPTEAEARQVVQSFQAPEAEQVVPPSDITSIDPDEPDTMIGGWLKGLTEGVAGGAKGYVKGLARSPIDLVQGVAGLVRHPVESIKSLPGALASIPDAMQRSAVDPEGWGKSVGSLAGQQMLTAGLPKAVPPVGRATGRALQTVGEHAFPWQLAAAHQMMGGNIPGSIGLAVAPEVFKRTGSALESAFRKRGAPTTPPVPLARTGASPVPQTVPGGAVPTPAAPPAAPPSLRIGGQAIAPSDPLFARLMELSGKPKAPAAPAALAEFPANPVEWGEMRRMYGADKAAELTGKTAAEVRTLAPGPSRIPLEVQERLLEWGRRNSR